MTNEEYKELNNFLEDTFMFLEDICLPYMDEVLFICKLTDSVYQLLDEYNLESESNKNKLTFLDVYNLAREILSTINKDYLNDFDNLIKSGELDFDYEDVTDDSYFEKRDEQLSINIKRNFNYSDVTVLIHEYIHYVNGKGKRTLSRELLSEYLSIYFEMYATDYLLEKGVPIEQIGISDRLKFTYDRVSDFHFMVTPFLSFAKFGKVGKDEHTLFKKYL